MKSITTLSILGLAVVVSLGTTALAESPWNQFRGPAGDGLSAEKGLLESWPADGPPELWRLDLGPAFSGITAAGDHLFTMTSDADGEYAVSLDLATGREVWRTRVGGQFEESFGNGPRSTPAIDGDRVFVLGSRGDLHALGRKDGAVQWSVDFKEAFGVEIPRRGFSGSIVLADDLLILQPGGPGGRSLAGVDKTSGEVRWTTGEDATGYSTPLLVGAGKERRAIVLSPTHALAVTPAGKVLWRHEFGPDIGVKPAIPVQVAPDQFFFSASYDLGGLLLREIGEGAERRVEEVWTSRAMRNHFNASVEIDGFLYGFDNATLKCLKVADASTAWAKRGGLGKGSLIYADGRLIVLTETGELRLVAADPEAYRELGRVQALSGRSWTSPTLYRGHLIVRNVAEIVAYDLRQASGGES